MQSFDDLALAGGLVDLDLDSQFGSLSRDRIIDLRKRLVAVDRQLATPQPIEIGAVQHENLHVDTFLNAVVIWSSVAVMPVLGEPIADSRTKRIRSRFFLSCLMAVKTPSTSKDAAVGKPASTKSLR